MLTNQAIFDITWRYSLSTSLVATFLIVLAGGEELLREVGINEFMEISVHLLVISGTVNAAILLLLFAGKLLFKKKTKFV